MSFVGCGGGSANSKYHKAMLAAKMQSALLKRMTIIITPAFTERGIDK
jgi:hypothetical protein